MRGDKGIENRGGKIERREKITTKKKKRAKQRARRGKIRNQIHFKSLGK